MEKGLESQIAERWAMEILKKIKKKEKDMRNIREIEKLARQQFIWNGELLEST